MNIPSFIQERVIDENGYFTPSWAFVIEQLLSQLQINAGAEGLVPSSLKTEDIAVVAASTNLQNGTLIYDSTTDQLKTNIAGTFKVITVT